MSDGSNRIGSKPPSNIIYLFPPFQGDLTSYQVKDENDRPTNGTEWTNGTQLTVEQTDVKEPKVEQPTLAEEEENLSLPDFDVVEKAWEHAKSASAKVLRALATPDPKFIQRLEKKLGQEYSEEMQGVSAWMADTFRKIGQHEIYKAGHDPNDPEIFDQWYNDKLRPKPNIQGRLSSPYEKVLRGRVPTLMRAIDSPIPSIQADAILLLSNMVMNFKDWFEQDTVLKVSMAAQDHMSSTVEKDRLAAATALERIAPLLPQGESKLIDLAKEMRSHMTIDETPTNLMLIDAYAKLTPRLPKGEPFSRPAEVTSAYLEFKLMVRDASSFEVKDKTNAALYILREEFPHLAKGELYNTLAEMGMRYHHSRKADPQLKSPPRGLQKDFVFLRKHMRSEDAAAQALAAIAMGAMSEVSKGKLILDIAQELSILMSNLPIKMPQRIETSEHEVSHLPFMSEEAIYRPYENHPSENAAHVVDRTIHLLTKGKDSSASAASNAYQQMALSLAPLALSEYSKLLVKLPKEHSEVVKIIGQAVVNYQAAKSSGISPEIRNHASRMLPYFDASGNRLGPLGIFAKNIRSWLK